MVTGVNVVNSLDEEWGGDLISMKNPGLHKQNMEGWRNIVITAHLAGGKKSLGKRLVQRSGGLFHSFGLKRVLFMKSRGLDVSRNEESEGNLLHGNAESSPAFGAIRVRISVSDQGGDS